ncbi:M3 family metallopeptidase [uncultured Prochlorococcus sp.]|uniref:M3 family metallopeptidase n=1 Tax=uncultured Prochlorococcus sp. TaxID=159733 RepID=UPI00258D9E1E|nr:M3 family metallopeptidase [uncultured Prochlorococcus sp.]
MQTSIFKYGELPEFKKFTPENISQQFPEVIDKIGKDFENIENNLSDYLIQNDLNWDKVINPLNEVNEILRWSWGVISHLNAVNNSESLRHIYSKFLPEIISLSNKFGQSKIIYKSLVKLKETNNFDQIRNRILDKEILEMQHKGISLKKKDQEDFNNISEKLGKLSTDFSNNVLDATNNWFLILNKKSEVDGLPERVLELMAISARNHLKKDGEVNVKNGPWKLSLDIPTYTAFMTYATDRNLREKLYKSFVGRASQGKENNSQIIEEILSLRTKQANLLGYKSWAELSLSTKMAKEIKNVENLLEELREPAFKTAKNELKKLDKFAKSNGFPQSQNIEPWDISYWSELLRKEKLNLDQESLRPWFPLNDVLKGLFRLSEKLFEIKVVEATSGAPSWNDEVLFFNILDKREEKIASFYLDPYSRPETKRGGAWMDECLNKNNLGKNTLPVAYLVCNQTPPSKDKPSLMSFEEVQTLFHEFGHGLQHMLTTVNLPQAAGINNVEWDAVELPSQFMENWCFHKNTLLNIARHYKTGEKLSDENFEKLLKNRTFNCGMATLRQLHFAITDLRLHSNIEKNKVKTADEIRREVAEETTVIAPIQEDQFLCCFSHIFAGGYSAGYYSYKWAEVLSADAFSMFEEADLENIENLKLIGKKFKDTVLSLGGSLPPLEIFKLFRGREPKTESLIRHLGLSRATS